MASTRLSVEGALLCGLFLTSCEMQMLLFFFLQNLQNNILYQTRFCNSGQ